MKKILALVLACITLLTLASCSASDKNDLTSISDYIAPSYDYKIATGTLTFAEGIGETAIISDYVGEYTAHTVTIPDMINERNVVAIGKEAFYYCTAMEAVVIPEGVTSIGDWAFAGCISLKEVVIPASVTSIGKGAFNGCTALTKVTFAGENVKSIADYAFNDCSALETLALPEGLENIGVEAFRDCEKLTSFKAPSTLLTMGDMVCYGCTGLNAQGAVVLSASIEKIGDFAFADVNKDYITAPEGSYAAKYVEEMKAFEEVESDTE